MCNTLFLSDSWSVFTFRVRVTHCDTLGANPFEAVTGARFLKARSSVALVKKVASTPRRQTGEALRTLRGCGVVPRCTTDRANGVVFGVLLGA